MNEQAKKLIKTGVKSIYLSVPILRLECSVKNDLKAKKLQQKLEDLGFIVMNPVQIGRMLEDRAYKPTYRNFMAQDIYTMLSCDAVVLERSWAGSYRCRTEVIIAQRCDMILLNENLISIPLTTAFNSIYNNLQPSSNTNTPKSKGSHNK